MGNMFPVAWISMGIFNSGCTEVPAKYGIIGFWLKRQKMQA